MIGDLYVNSGFFQERKPEAAFGATVDAAWKTSEGKKRGLTLGNLGKTMGRHGRKGLIQVGKILMGKSPFLMGKSPFFL